MSFISKTIRDRAISGQVSDPWALRPTPLGPLKDVDFSEIRPPSSILVAMENVYLVNHNRPISGKFWTPWVLKMLLIKIALSSIIIDYFAF